MGLVKLAENPFCFATGAELNEPMPNRSPLLTNGFTGGEDNSGYKFPTLLLLLMLTGVLLTSRGGSAGGGEATKAAGC